MRESGIEKTGVAEVMKAADMTHGGFYRHFASKDALVAEAIRHAADQTIGRFDGLAGEELRAELRGYLATYLSTGHVANPGIGCPIAATAEEGARADGDIRKVYAEMTRRLHGAFVRALEDRVGDPEGEAWRMVATIVGAVTVARTLDDLDAVRVVLKSAASAARIPEG